MEIVGGLPRYRKIISEFTELVIEILLNSYRRFFSMSSCMRNNVYVPMVGVSEDPGGGGYSRFQVTGMIEWGKKKISLGFKQNPPKTRDPITRKVETLVLNTPKNPY